MLLYPTPTEEEAMASLLPQATAIWGEEKEDELRKALEPMIKALIALSEFEVPEDTEPLFP